MSGYSVLAEFRGDVPADRIEYITDELVEELDRHPGTVAGAVVSIDERGVDLRFSVLFDYEPDLLNVSTVGGSIALTALEVTGLTLSLEALQVQTDAYVEEELSTPTPEIVGLSEIADILGVSRQRVGQLREREDFPLPIANLAAGPVWRRDMLERFISEWERRPGRPSSWEHIPELIRYADPDETKLTARERQVLALLVEGATAQVISDRLGASPDAVRSAVRRILAKLHVHSRLEAVAVAVREEAAREKTLAERLGEVAERRAGAKTNSG